VTWKEISPVFDRWIPAPRTLHPYPNVRFDARIQGRTAVYGPACPVVWEGSSRKAIPYAECAEHVRQLEGESPFHNLMEVK